MTIKYDVRLVTLPAMRVISANGFGKEPEAQAWQKMREWIIANGLESAAKEQRFFGFNNPDPAPGSENYGYEQWMTLPASYEPKEGDAIKEFNGGLYAMLGFRESDPSEFGQAWKALNTWQLDSEYDYDESRQWLEECVTAGAVLNNTESGLGFDCYMPIRPRG
jgi:DNA gyrase inhibitor GyrI